MKTYKGWKRHKHGGRRTAYSNGDMRIYRESDCWLLTMCGGKVIARYDSLDEAIAEAAAERRDYRDDDVCIDDLIGGNS